MKTILKKNIRVIIADDHEVFRDGLLQLLNRFEDIEVVAEAADGIELSELATKLHPDIILTDVDMPRMNGVEATRNILSKNPRIKIIAISLMDYEYVVVDMLEAGAVGYLSKNNTRDEIAEAIRNVYKGLPHYDSASSVNLIHRIAKSKYYPGNEKKRPDFSDREREIIRLTCELKTSHEIGEILSISARTVETHRLNIHRKMQVTSSVGVAVYAIKNGLWHITPYKKEINR